MNLIDVHAHMDYPPLNKKVDEAVANAKEKGIKVIISNGTNSESNRNVKKLSKEYEIIKPAYGFYPTHVQEVTEDELDEELSWIEENKPIAIGEVGLDYKFTNKEPQEAQSNEVTNVQKRKGSREPTEEQKQLIEKQKKGFKKIINLAKKLDLPLIVHSRKAESDVIDMLEASGHKKIIMHCFSGKKKLVSRIIDNGWTFSVPVIVTKLQQFQEMVKETPMSQLLTETDSPFLGPEPGLTNEPANVAISIKKIAELKGLTETETADQIYMNYMRLFL